jgi:hypothetical protein
MFDSLINKISILNQDFVQLKTAAIARCNENVPAESNSVALVASLILITQ